MATNTAPSPNFSGINFNPSFFSTSTSLTVEEADTLYLNKSVADTANVLETFTVGIATNALQSATATITSLLADTIDSVGTTFTMASTNATTLNIGNSLSTTNLNGNVQLTTPLRLPIVTTSPTNTQLGYFNSNVSTAELTVSGTNSIPAPTTITNLPIGIYLVNYFVTSYAPTVGASQVFSYSVTTTGSATSNIQTYIFNAIATTFQDTQNLSGIVKCTTATNTTSLNLIRTAGTGSMKASYYGYNYIKIA